MAARVVAQTAPLQILTGAMVLGSLLWLLATGDPMLLGPAARVEAAAAIGLAGGFAVHEVAHAAVIRRCRGVTHVVVTATAWRFSLEPRGRISPAELVLVALAGPATAAAIGLVFLTVAPHLHLHWWFLAHLAFLLPVFGDGRSLVIGAGLVLRPGRGS